MGTAVENWSYKVSIGTLRLAIGAHRKAIDRVSYGPAKKSMRHELKTMVRVFKERTR